MHKKTNQFFQNIINVKFKNVDLRNKCLRLKVYRKEKLANNIFKVNTFCDIKSRNKKIKTENLENSTRRNSLKPANQIADAADAGKGKRKRMLYGLETALLVVVLAAGCLWIAHTYIEHQTQQQIAEKILRFHVRANSDSKQDQELKLKVRDAVGAYMQHVLVGSEDLTSCIQVVQSCLPDLIDTAKQVVAQEGYHYAVTARIAQTKFPEKTYGNYTFPAGTYQALNVVIGNGEGQNWWCVMYPNMCFHGAVYEVVDEEADKSLQRILSDDEYYAVLKNGKYKIKFKYLRFIEKIFGLDK